jgi:cyclopropane fatty-acyl-phospholipid synthase-like methyltransferase
MRKKIKGEVVEFYNDPIKVDEYESMCEEYDGSELYAVLDKHLTDNSTLLELGSGPGNDINYLKKKYSVTGSDLSDEFLTRCKKKHADVSFINLDAVSIKSDKLYDCVFSNKVLHHLTLEELEKSLKRQQEVIVTNGLFAHTFWLGDKEFLMEGMLFMFYNREHLVKLVSKYFTIIKLYDYKEFEEGDSIFILAKNDKNA